MQRPGPTLLAMARAYRTSQLVYVAAKLGIADELAAGPRTCEDLATTLGLSADALCRVMRGLYVLSLFDQLEDGRYTLTDLARPLLSDAPDSVRAGIIWIDEEQYQAWGQLLRTVKTGEAGFKTLFGDPYAHYEENVEAGKVFDSWMAVASAQVVEGIAQGYEFPETGTVIDVGGGEGVLLAAVLKPRPGLKGVLLDRASVVEKARRVLREAEVLERCTLVAGDFREWVPPGGDVYVLKNILHDWSDSAAVSILTACRQAMAPTARLVVFQRAVPENASNPDLVRSMVEADLMLMVYSGGRERTLSQYRALLEAAGLSMSYTMESGGTTRLMEATPKAID